MFLLAYAFIAIILVRWLYHSLTKYFFVKNPPGPKGWPIIKNTFQIQHHRLHLTIFDHRDKYGDISYFQAAGIDFVTLNSVDAIREALKDDKYAVTFAGRPKTFFSEYLTPKGLVHVTYSDSWHKIRKTSQVLIKPYAHELKKIEIVIVSELDKFKKCLDENLNTPFNIHRGLAKSVANIVYIMLCGERFGYDHEIHNVQYATYIADIKLINPIHNFALGMFPFLHYLNIGSGKISQAVERGQNTLIKYIEHTNQVDSDEKQGFFFELLRQSKESEWMTIDHVHGTTKNLINAGSITTSTSLYTLFLIFLKWPHIQEAIQNEVDETVGEKREPCLDDQENMPYTQAVIFELLRYHSLLPYLIPHSTLKDVKFRGYDIKKNTVILANVFRVHHDEELWDDPWMFEPERFLDDNGGIVSPDHHNRRNLLAFGIGKRRCIGDVFARTRMFLFITHLCQRYTMYTDNADELPNVDPRCYEPYLVQMPPAYNMKLKRRI